MNFSSNINIPVSFNRSNFTLVFSKSACHANPDMEKKVTFIYFKTNNSNDFKYIS